MKSLGFDGPHPDRGRWGRRRLRPEAVGEIAGPARQQEQQQDAGNHLTIAGLPLEVVNTVINLQTSFAAGAFDIVTGDVERVGGRPPKPLRDVLARALRSPSA